MTTMDTVEDFLRILRERPDVREAVRREILTEEILALPQMVAEIAAMVRELVRVQAEHTARIESLGTDVKGLKTDMVEVKADVKGLKTDMVEVKADVKGLKTDMVEVKADVKGLKTDMVEVKADVKGLKGDVSDLQTKVGGLMGSDLERRILTLLPPLLSQRLGLRRTRTIHHPNLTPSLESAFIASIERAADEERIMDSDEERLRVTDLVLHARRKDDGAEVWIAVEASGTIGQDDVDRASQSAGALQAAFEEVAVAVVVGYRIRDEDRARAEADGVTVLVVEEPRG